jgi:MerR family copper efflux transcriptional regulator
MRIGELARRAGVNIQTIRFYERKRLLPPPPRTSGGYRAYSDGDLVTVGFIRECQQLGFTLREITDLLTLHRPTSDAKASRLFKLVTSRLALIDERIRILMAMRDRLAAAIDGERARLTFCPASVERPPKTT